MWNALRGWRKSSPVLTLFLSLIRERVCNNLGTDFPLSQLLKNLKYHLLVNVQFKKFDNSFRISLSWIPPIRLIIVQFIMPFSESLKPLACLSKRYVLIFINSSKPIRVGNKIYIHSLLHDNKETQGLRAELQWMNSFS